jgi:hypothetical protein
MDELEELEIQLDWLNVALSAAESVEQAHSISEQIYRLEEKIDELKKSENK